MKKPMPAAVPCFRQSGMSLTMCSRMLVSVRSRKSVPERKTTPSAVCHGTPRPKNNRVREVCVQRHSGSECDRIIRPQAHHQSGERRGNAGCKEHALDRHPRFTQNARIHDHHVGHGHERRQPAKKFAANRGLVFREMENSLEQCAPL